MTKKLQLAFTFLLVFIAQIANAQRQDSILFSETFELLSPTPGSWGVYADPNCNKSWTYYDLSGSGANGSDIVAGYESSQDFPGCFSVLYTPVINLKPKYANDSIELSLYLYRTTTASSDKISLYIVNSDEDTILTGPAEIYQYNAMSPATGAGWTQLQWKVAVNQLTVLDSQKITYAFLAESDGGEDLLIDDVSIKHIWHLPTSSITVLAPNGGEILTPGQSKLIEWESQGVNFVDIEYSLNSGLSWTSIIQDLNAKTNNSFLWIVPMEETTTGIVRVKDSDNSDISDESDSTFTLIYPRELTVSSPNGGETFTPGNTTTISWTSEFIEFVDIDYTLNNGATWLPVIHNLDITNINSYLWTLPNAETTQGKIRITDADGSGISDQTDGFFTSTYPRTLTLTYPNGGETLTPGDNVSITWQSAFINNVNISYSIDGGVNWVSIAQNLDAANINSYMWTVPAIETSEGIVRITDAAHSNITDESNSMFTIAFPKELRITSPNGGESLMYGTTAPITWQSSKINNINIQYSVNGGIDWIDVTLNISANTGIYNWTVPKNVSNSVKIRLVNVADVSVTDESDANFSIIQNTSIHEFTETTGFNIYPNPAHSNITLLFNKQLSEKANIIITDIAGKTVYEQTFINTQPKLNIMLPKLPAGLYNVKVSTANSITVQKLILQ